MKKVFVSGCYDILHAGHLQFFREAKSLGDYLVVSFASEEVLWEHKKRLPTIPDDHKMELLRALSMIDEVVIGTDKKIGLDFESDFKRIKPDLLVVTEDDKYGDIKRKLCTEVGAEYIVLKKTSPKFKSISTSEIIRYIKAPKEVPVRVDFAGGWLDVPRLAQKGSYIVNCAISPTVSLKNWPYKKQCGLGGSAAWAIINGLDGVEEELNLDVGWQDPAVIYEGGLCVWKSGDKPVLDFKINGEILAGKMAILWTNLERETSSKEIKDKKRPYEVIKKAGDIAAEGVKEGDLNKIINAVNKSYEAQLLEGMQELPDIEGAKGKKYCGSGWGGYALYLFDDESTRKKALQKNDHLQKVEPWNK